MASKAKRALVAGTNNVYSLEKLRAIRAIEKYRLRYGDLAGAKANFVISDDVIPDKQSMTYTDINGDEVKDPVGYMDRRERFRNHKEFVHPSGKPFLSHHERMLNITDAMKRRENDE